MDWTRYVDGYCERTDPSFWSEPINALTNASFVISALILWPRMAGMPFGRVLCLLLASVGVGSFLFHTLATYWASLADIVPIAILILAYIYAANRDFWGLPVWLAVAATAAFVPYAMVLTPVFDAMPFFTISSFYWTVPLLIFVYAAALRGRAPRTAAGLAVGGAALLVSLSFRSVDMAVCADFPLGTHFMWHLLNGILIGWLIEVWRRHALDGGGARG